MSRHSILLVATGLVLVCSLFTMLVGAQSPSTARHLFLIPVIDVSPTMISNDPEGWRFDAAKFLIGALDEGDEVALFTFASETKPVVATSPPLRIAGTQDKLDLWSTIDMLRTETSPAGNTTDFLVLFQRLSDYLGGLDPRTETHTILLLLTDGQDYTTSCVQDQVKCRQHRQQALEAGQSLRAMATRRFRDDQQGKLFTFLPIGLKGPTAEYDLDFLGEVSGQAKEKIPQADSPQLLSIFAEQVIGRMLDRVAIPAAQTDQRGVYQLQIPPGVLSLTIAATRSQAGQALYLAHPTADQSVAAATTCARDGKGCLATVENPSPGTWWVQSTGGGDLVPQALLRFAPVLSAVPAVVPLGKPVTVTADLQDHQSHFSLLQTGNWRVTPSSVGVNVTPPAGGQQSTGTQSASVEATVGKGATEELWTATVLAWPALLDRAGLGPLSDEYTLAPGETLQLEVIARVPPDPQFRMGTVYARAQLGEHSQEIPLLPAGGDHFAGDLDVLAMLDAEEKGTLQLSYEVRGASYGAFEYPADWWRVQESKTPTITRVRNVVSVDSQQDWGWLRSRSVSEQMAITVTCSPCEEAVPLGLKLVDPTLHGQSASSADVVLLTLPEPLKPGETRKVTVDAGRLSSLLSAAAGKLTLLPFITAQPVRGGVDTRGMVGHIDNRTELQLLREDGGVLDYSLGLLGIGFFFERHEARYLWVIPPLVLGVCLTVLSVWKWHRGRGWWPWLPLALLGGGVFGLLATVARRAWPQPRFAHDLEVGLGAGDTGRLALLRSAPSTFEGSNDPMQRHALRMDWPAPWVYFNLKAEGGRSVRLRGLRNTRIWPESASDLGPALGLATGDAGLQEEVRMIPGVRYFFVAPAATTGDEDSSGSSLLRFPGANWKHRPWIRLAVEEARLALEHAGQSEVAGSGSMY